MAAFLRGAQGAASVLKEGDPCGRSASPLYSSAGPPPGPPQSSPLRGPGTIADIENAVRALPKHSRRLVRRVFAIDLRTSAMEVPEAFKPRLNRWLGDVAEGDAAEAWRLAREQTIICVTNRWLYETTHFNPLRACRPVTIGASRAAAGKGKGEADGLEREIVDAGRDGMCDFCDVRNMTAAEQWGRVETPYCITSSNAFKSEAAHGLMILKRHHPLRFTAAEIVDAMGAAARWFREAAEAVRRERRKRARERAEAAAVALAGAAGTAAGGEGAAPVSAGAAAAAAGAAERLPPGATAFPLGSSTAGGASGGGEDRDSDDSEDSDADSRAGEADVAVDADLHPFFLWNCLHKSGATQVHPHGQMMLAPAPFGRMRLLRDAARRYAEVHGSDADLVADMVAVHEALGLCVRMGSAAMFASLTPRSGKGEIVVVARASSPDHPDFARALAAAMLALVRRLGVRSFSLAISVPPMGAAAADDEVPPFGSAVTGGAPAPAAGAGTGGSSGGGPVPLTAAATGKAPLGARVPTPKAYSTSASSQATSAPSSASQYLVARLWNRGDPLAHTVDIGAPELLGLAVGVLDPFALMPSLRAAADAIDEDLRVEPTTQLDSGEVLPAPPRASGGAAGHAAPGVRAAGHGRGEAGARGVGGGGGIHVPKATGAGGVSRGTSAGGSSEDRLMPVSDGTVVLEGSVGALSATTAASDVSEATTMS